MNLMEKVSRPIYVFNFVFVFLLLVYFFLPEKEILRVDENIHYWQIVSFLTGDFKVMDKLTTLPGYHLFFALLGFIFRTGSVVAFRIISVFIAALTVAMLSAVDRSVNGRISYNKVVLIVFFPIFFPYFFLIYTDILSMFIFLSSLYLGFKKHYQMAAFLGILNLMVRQNTFFWFIFTFALLFVTHYPLSYRDFINYIKKGWMFIFGIVVFILFIIINKGIAVGDRSMHPGTTFHLGNIYFFLILTGLLICPFKITFIKPGYFKTHHYLIIIVILIIYWNGFKITHPYNFLGDGFFVRNEFLRIISGNVSMKGLSSIPMTAAVMLFIRLYQSNAKVFFLYFLFGILTLVPSWLIEQRYYCIHFILLVIYGFREGFPKYSPAVLLAYLGLSLFLVHSIFINSFFL